MQGEVHGKNLDRDEQNKETTKPPRVGLRGKRRLVTFPCLYPQIVFFHLQTTKY